MSYDIRDLVLLNLSDSLRKRDKMLGKSRIYLFSSTCLINSIKHEYSCKILYMTDITINNRYFRSSNVVKFSCTMTKNSLKSIFLTFNILLVSKIIIALCTDLILTNRFFIC